MCEPLLSVLWWAWAEECRQVAALRSPGIEPALEAGIHNCPGHMHLPVLCSEQTKETEDGLVETRPHPWLPGSERETQSSPPPPTGAVQFLLRSQWEAGSAAPAPELPHRVLMPRTDSSSNAAEEEGSCEVQGSPGLCSNATAQPSCQSHCPLQAPESGTSSLSGSGLKETFFF